jgi:ribose-phosphate pyrophosphokinase
MFDLRLKMKEPVVVAADLGFAKKGRNFAASLDAPIAFVEKRRSGDDARPAALTLIGNVEERDVIVVDDEIDTAGSIIQAVKLVKEKGARDVYAVCVHPVFSEKAAEQLAKLPLNRIITTDTVPIPKEEREKLAGTLEILSVAPLLGEVIRRAHEGRSVGEMFNE